MQSIKRQTSRLGIKAVIIVLGVVVLSGWIVTEGARRPQVLLPQQEPPIIIVCPQGPPFCPFSRIQDAINAAPDGSSATGYVPPTKIIVAPGTYEENLVISKSVILQGAERDQVILRPRPGGGRETRAIIVVVGSIHPVYFQISGFTFQQTSNKGGGVGIHLAGQGYGSLIYNNRFQNSDAGVYAVYSARMVIRDNLFERGEFGGSGIGMLDAAIVEITGNTFLNLGKDFQDIRGIAIAGSRGRSPEGSRIRVIGNTFRDLRGYGIVVSDSVGVEIQENTIENALTGIDVFDSSEAITIQNNLVRSQLADGISVSGSSVVVKGNRVEENQGQGIEIQKSLIGAAPAVQLLENQILRNGRFGIWAERVEYVMVCKGNQVRENKAGDYGSGTITEPQPSPELKQKCEGN